LALTFGGGLTIGYREGDVREVPVGGIGDFGTQTEGDKAEMSGCPFAPAPPAVIEAMLSLARIDASAVLYDLSFDSGDVVIQAARKYKARAADFETFDIPKLREKARQAGVADLVRFPDEGLWSSSVGAATAVTVNHYVNQALKKKLLSELKPGVRIVSWAYGIQDWPPDEVVDTNGRKLLVWTVPRQ
jgi:hypothetical protein